MTQGLETRGDKCIDKDTFTPFMTNPATTLELVFSLMLHQHQNGLFSTATLGTNPKEKDAVLEMVNPVV